MSPEEWTLKTRPTHKLKHIWVTKRVHIENQANLQTGIRQATVSPEECTLQTRSTHCLKQDRAYLYYQKSAHWKSGQLTNWNRTGHITRVHIKKTRLTHLLKQDRPHSVSPEDCTLKTRLTHLLNKTGHVCVTRRMHMTNQANSQTEIRQTTLCVTRRVHIEKAKPTHSLKQNRPDLCHQQYTH